MSKKHATTLVGILFLSAFQMDDVRLKVYGGWIMSTDLRKGLMLTKKALLWSVSLILIVLACPMFTFAQDAQTSQAGGTGGNSFSVTCGEEKAMIGIKGRAGIWVDSIQGICSSYDANSRRTGSQTFTQSTGGSGGAPYELVCPVNQVVSGISGRAGGFLDQIKIQCSNIASNGHITGGATALSGSAGGMGGTPFGPIPCPDNKPAKGLTGRSSIYIDRIGLICNFPLIFDSDLKSFRISSTEINAGGSATGTVTLEGLAPSAGVVVNLSSTNSGLATVPPSVTISSRQSSGTFSINAPPGANGGCVDITTSSNGKSQSNPLSVQPAPPANAGFSLSVPPILHFVGDTITGTILLNAPVSGTGTVTLVSSDPSKATVPASISVAVGKATFQINTSAQGCVGISATYNGVTVRRVVKVLRRDG